MSPAPRRAVAPLRYGARFGALEEVRDGAAPGSAPRYGPKKRFPGAAYGVLHRPSASSLSMSYVCIYWKAVKRSIYIAHQSPSNDNLFNHYIQYFDYIIQQFR